MAESLESNPQPKADPTEIMFLSEPSIHVELTHSHLDVLHTMSLVKSPEAGAVVMFAGISSQKPFF